MARLRYVKGNYTKIIGGDYDVWATGNINLYSAKKLYIQAEEGIVLGTEWTEPPEAPMYVLDRIINGYWSSDKEGKNKINSAELGETVYFTVKTKDIPAGTKLKLQLYESDIRIPIHQVLTDDGKINGKEIIKYLELKPKYDPHHGYMINTFEFYLDPKWSTEISKDGFLGFGSRMLELYWLSNYNDKQLKLPRMAGDFLNVRYSSQNLFIKADIELPENQLPELYTNAGKTIVFLLGQTPTGEIKNYVSVSLDLKTITRTANFESKRILLKQNLRIENINLRTGEIKVHDINCPAEVIDYRVKESFQMIDSKSTMTEVFRKKKFSEFFNKTDLKTGAKIGLDKAIKVLDFIFLEQDLLKMLPQGSSQRGSWSASTISGIATLNLGSFAKINGFSFLLAASEIVVKGMKQEWYAEWNSDFIWKLQKYKSYGVEAVRKLLRSVEPSFRCGYLLEEYSMNTINELFKGNFKTIQEMDDFEDDNVSPVRHEVLIREIENKNKLIYEYYIEAIFI